MFEPASGPSVKTVSADGHRAGLASGNRIQRSGLTVALEDGRILASEHRRDDLARALQDQQEQLKRTAISVAVVGEYKSGKSTLINALLQTNVCPADADVATVVPTIVRYGQTPSAMAYTGVQAGQVKVNAIPLDAISDNVAEAGNPGNVRVLRSVEVLLNHQMLRSGLCLVDTPGVGGLESAHGVSTKGAIELADGMLFVTDASQELSVSELDYLRDAVRRCPQAACVVTKTDLYRYWRRIVSIDQAHLKRAGLEVPVVALSSYLRLAAQRDQLLTEESGYPALVEFLISKVMRPAQARKARVAATCLDFAAGQVGRDLSAEREMLTRPDKESVLAELAEERMRTSALVASTAQWQKDLADGVQDLVAQVTHDLQNRFRTVRREAEDLIEAADPKDTWADIGIWLRKRVVEATVSNGAFLTNSTDALIKRISEEFLAAGAVEPLSAGSRSTEISSVHLPPVTTLIAPGGRITPLLSATRSAMFLPMALFGAAGGLLGSAALLAAPLTLMLGGIIGVRVIRDEKLRQVTYRRQQAKGAIHRFVNEVEFIVSEDSRDALRRTQRLLRDDFQARASSLHTSSERALTAAKAAGALSGPDRSARLAALEAQAQAVRNLRVEVRETASHTQAVAP